MPRPVKIQSYDFKKGENGLAWGRIWGIRSLGQKFLLKITSFTTSFPEEQSLILFWEKPNGLHPPLFHWNNPHVERWQGKKDSEGRILWCSQGELFTVPTPIHFPRAGPAGPPGTQSCWVPNLWNSLTGRVAALVGHRWKIQEMKFFKRMANTFACLSTLPVISIPIDLSRWIQFQVKC